SYPCASCFPPFVTRYSVSVTSAPLRSSCPALGQIRPVGDGTGQFANRRAFRLAHHAARVGQLAQAAAVRPHRKDLAATRIGAERIAARVEDQVPRSGILAENE